MLLNVKQFADFFTSVIPQLFQYVWAFYSMAVLSCERNIQFFTVIDVIIYERSLKSYKNFLSFFKWFFDRYFSLKISLYLHLFQVAMYI